MSVISVSARPVGRPRLADSSLGSNFSRNLAILNRHLAGEPLSEIGADLGLTRERVRQIVAGFDAPAKREMLADRNRQILARIKEGDLTADEAAAEFGIQPAVAYHIGHQAGHVFRRDTKRDSEMIAALAERVKVGESIQSLAAGDHSIRGLLWEYCKRNGIKSRHGRHRDFSARYEIIERSRQEGMTWEQVAKEVARAEGKPLVTGAVCTWVARYMPEQIRSRTERLSGVRLARTPKVKPVRPAKPKPRIILASNPKDAARLNYGRAPASIIAAVHGVSRNSIIGYWFRLRQQGQLGNVNTAYTKNNPEA